MRFGRQREPPDLREPRRDFELPGSGQLETASDPADEPRHLFGAGAQPWSRQHEQPAQHLGHVQPDRRRHEFVVRNSPVGLRAAGRGAAAGGGHHEELGNRSRPGQAGYVHDNEKIGPVRPALNAGESVNSAT